VYSVKKLSNTNYQVTNLNDDPKMYTVVKSSKGHYSCDCMGFSRQKDKTQHKHCLMVKALEDMQDFNWIMLDSDWRVVNSHSEILDQLESFMDEIVKG
jgi:hypothetical protein